MGVALPGIPAEVEGPGRGYCPHFDGGPAKFRLAPSREVPNRGTPLGRHEATVRSFGAQPIRKTWREWVLR
jgi:hypothetical protein